MRYLPNNSGEAPGRRFTVVVTFAFEQEFSLDVWDLCWFKDKLYVATARTLFTLERDQLMELVKGRAWAAFDRSIDQRVGRLRRKIEPDPDKPRIIKAVRGVGYLFAPAVSRV